MLSFLEHNKSAIIISSIFFVLSLLSGWILRLLIKISTSYEDYVYSTAAGISLYHDITSYFSLVSLLILLVIVIFFIKKQDLETQKIIRKGEEIVKDNKGEKETLVELEKKLEENTVQMKEEIEKLKKLSNKGRYFIYVIFLVIFFYSYQWGFQAYVYDIRSDFEINIIRASSIIEEKSVNQLRSQWTMMTNKGEFDKIMLKIDSVLISNNIPVEK